MSLEDLLPALRPQIGGTYAQVSSFARDQSDARAQLAFRFLVRTFDATHVQICSRLGPAHSHAIRGRPARRSPTSPRRAPSRARARPPPSGGHERLGTADTRRCRPLSSSSAPRGLYRSQQDLRLSGHDVGQRGSDLWTSWSSRPRHCRARTRTRNPAHFPVSASFLRKRCPFGAPERSSRNSLQSFWGPLLPHGSQRTPP